MSAGTAPTISSNGTQLRIKGKVQGVGFRPYVWQIAHDMGLLGDVCNDAEGVLVRLLNNDTLSAPVFSDFIEQLYQRCPPLAKIESLHHIDMVWDEIPIDFTIRSSGDGQMDTRIIPDAATCDACLTELFDPNNRRYHYPFTNCTHCGPRFTIIKKMPYDRPYTAMADFPFCPRCKAEYESPADRRFHAQPNACADCGPHIWIADHMGHHHQCRDDAALDKVAAHLIAGGIVAIKGLGGFHLACDATNDVAVKLLRQRKHRPSKPFAVMLPNTDWLARCCAQNDGVLQDLLKSSPAPIVLVTKSKSSCLSSLIAPDLNEVGVMLPSNPLQHLLMNAVDIPLVMTSGNASGKPPALTNEGALSDLVGIADLWLMHNRDIIQRADDSLVRYVDGHAEIMRRARGYVPDAIDLPQGFDNMPSVLAMGADLKNTFCLLRDNSAVVSQHLGDLDDVDIQKQYEKSLVLFEDIYRFKAQAIAADPHPSYISYRYAKQWAETRQLPLIATYHHHAHIVSCMAEHGLPKNGKPVIGLALDGLGYGQNGELWGGECLLVDYKNSQHLGGLPAVEMPGGNKASVQPWRNLLAHMMRFVPDWQDKSEALTILSEPWPLLEKAVNQGVNSPKASSCGRLFDAVAAALGICDDQISWEGEAACKLEAIAHHSSLKSTRGQWHNVIMPVKEGSLDLTTFWQSWLAYKGATADRAYAFHDALAKGFADLARYHAEAYSDVDTVVLSGGVMHNRLLRQLLTDYLSNKFDVLCPQRLPMGDGGLAFGQALIAAANLSD